MAGLGSIRYSLALVAGLYTRFGCGSRLSWSRLQIPVKLTCFLLLNRLGIQSSWKVPICYRTGRHVWTVRHRSDLSVLDEIFVREEYGLEIETPKTIVDLGANIGGASIYFAHRWPAAKIHAFEPNPETFERLVDSTRFYPNITCYPFAASGTDGAVSFSISSDHLGSGIGPTVGHTLTVQSKSLRTIVEMLGGDVDLLKFDIEGAEETLFADQWFRGRVRALVGEVHKEKMGISVDAFLKSLDGFDIRRRFEDDKYILLEGHWVT